FFETFGVRVKSEGSLYLFKYDQINAKWTHDLTVECRGSILTMQHGKWYFLARPADKFWNHQEGRCPLFGQDIPEDAVLCEKADGTCIQLWFDGDRWRISTLGQITTNIAQHGGHRFDDLFKESLKQSGILGAHNDGPNTFENYTSQLDRSYTYVFELCTEHNVVVNEYEERRVFFLYRRDNISGNYDVSSALDSHTLGSQIKSWPSTYSTEHLQELLESDPQVFGHRPEGFVVWSAKDYQKPLAKLKFKEYVHAHHISDPLRYRKIAIQAFYAGSYDDVEAWLPEHRRKLLEPLLGLLHAENEAVCQWVHDVHDKFPELEDRKAFAIYLQKDLQVSRTFQGFFFHVRDWSKPVSEIV
ncbi:MAG: RNA ligase, partial [Bacteroidota bacterium]